MGETILAKQPAVKVIPTSANCMPIRRATDGKFDALRTMGGMSQREQAAYMRCHNIKGSENA